MFEMNDHGYQRITKIDSGRRNVLSKADREQRPSRSCYEVCMVTDGFGVEAQQKFNKFCVQLSQYWQNSCSEFHVIDNGRICLSLASNGSLAGLLFLLLATRSHQTSLVLQSPSRISSSARDHSAASKIQIVLAIFSL